MAQGDRAVVISEGKFLRLMKQGHWEYVSRNGVSGVVAIIAVTNDRKLVLAGTSLLLFAITAALWVRSYWVSEYWRIVIVDRASGLWIGDRWLASGRGGVLILCDSTPPTLIRSFRIEEFTHREQSFQSVSLSQAGFWRPNVLVDRFGFAYASELKSRLIDYSSGPEEPEDFESTVAIRVPYGFVAGVFLLLPTLAVWRWQRQRRWALARLGGRCTTCGYDLRATPDRCPECGTVAKLPPVQASDKV